MKRNSAPLQDTDQCSVSQWTPLPVALRHLSAALSRRPGRSTAAWPPYARPRVTRAPAGGRPRSPARPPGGTNGAAGACVTPRHGDTRPSATAAGGRWSASPAPARQAMSSSKEPTIMTDVSSRGPAPGDERKVLTNRQGHPVYDNQNQRTVGARGPATLENYQFLEKISHSARDRIPEPVVHARGVTAFGHFEAYGKWGDEPISRYTRAKLFQEAGKRTDVAVRFSTVIGGRDSSEGARDPRGFAVKFYTEDGNWDLVGNNLGVFFILDAIKFPDVIHALRPDRVTFEQQPRRIFDFMSQTPESMHMLVNLFSPRGIPSDYRHMQGFGVNTYKWVNEAGETKLVKYHWMPKQGVRSMTEEDAANVQADSLGHATKDLYEAVARGEYPEWELLVQMMDDHDHPELDFDPLDDTKTWPEQDFPPKPVGRMVLDRMPENYFAENEQISFGTGVLVDGLDFSDDKMLVGRTFSYSDTQ